MSPDPRKIQALMAMPLPKCKKELQSSLGIINYLSTFSPMTAEVHKSPQKLTPVKTEWLWNSMYQDLYDKAKHISQQDACMKFHDASKLLYLEADASSLKLGASL